MLRKKALLICLAAVVLSVAGIALAKAVKVDLKNPPGLPAGDPDTGATGRAVLNYAKGADKTIIQINCEGLTPGATYIAGIWGVGALPGSYTALPNGKLVVHGTMTGDVSGMQAAVARMPVSTVVLLSP